MKKKKCLILIQTEHKLRILKNGLKLIQIEYKLGIKLCIDNLTAYSDIVKLQTAFLDMFTPVASQVMTY